MDTTPANDPNNETDGEICHAETVADARRLARRAKTHEVYCVIGPDGGLDVRTSRAGILNALKGYAGSEPCGGVYWAAFDTFRLDRAHS